LPEDVIEPLCATVDTSKRHLKITRDTGRVNQSYLMGVLMRMSQEVESCIFGEQNVGSDVCIHHRLNLIRVLLHKLLSLHPTSIVHNDTVASLVKQLFDLLSTDLGEVIGNDLSLNRWVCLLRFLGNLFQVCFSPRD